MFPESCLTSMHSYSLSVVKMKMKIENMTEITEYGQS